MAGINFKKSTGNCMTDKEIDDLLAERREKKQALNAKLRRTNAALSYTSENQWILPSVQKILDENAGTIRERSEGDSDKSESSDDITKRKKDKKRKKNKRDRSKNRRNSTSSCELESKSSKHKKQRRSKKRRHRSSSSNSDSSNKSENKIPPSKERDEWMTLESKIPTYTRAEKTKKKIKETSINAAPGQTSRELNPYWKNGGCGIPLNAKESDMKNPVGDKGLDRYKEALIKAQATAIQLGRTLTDVISERWGESLAENPGIMKKRHNGYSESSDSSDDIAEKRKDVERERFKRDRSRSRRKSTSSCESESKRSKQKKSKKHRHRSSSAKEENRSSKPRVTFQIPGSEFGRLVNTDTKDKKGNWLKNPKEREETSRSYETGEKDKRRKSCDPNEINTCNKESSQSQPQENPSKASEEQSVKILSDGELNKLAAKLTKAEILGKTDQILKFKKELEAARATRQAAIDDAGAVKAATNETVVLVQLSNKGLARPYQRPAIPEPAEGRRKNKKVETHRDGERVRYFPDDDQRDLKQMFESEKFGSHDDEKALFLKLASKHAGADVEEDDAIFDDVARVAESTGKQQQRDLQQAVKETHQRHKNMDNCRLCLESPKVMKNLIVSLGKKSYLSLPVTPLTPLHCQVVPLEHSICGTQLDEDVWEEIHNYRLSLIAMAKALNQYVIFFEDARSFKKYPHMVMQCIMVNKEDGELAPIYFKKALLDCEGEWTTNKKVVDIKGKDVRGAIPKGLPYFSVEFPPDSGFAHVIENEDCFPPNFAQSVIGGMLDLDHRLWSKSNKNNDNPKVQRERTIEFSKKFLKYAFNSKAKSSKFSSSSSSDTSSDSD